MKGARGLPDAIKQIVPVYYRAFPDLVPFAGGDRAGVLGEETAEAFARRKIFESGPGSPNSPDRPSSRKRRGPPKMPTIAANLSGGAIETNRDGRTGERLLDKVWLKRPSDLPLYGTAKVFRGGKK